MKKMDDPSAYSVPSGPGTAEYEEKRSRFIGYLQPAEDEEAARAFIAAIKKKHYDARHNCWCYILKDGPERYSDDGEPQGTAGIPMLEMLRREEITNVVCVVTRYFGGVLLGTGGLVRAYTKAAKGALEDAGVSVMRKWTECGISCPYSLFERIKTEISAVSGVITETEYGTDILITASIPSENLAAFSGRIRDITSGSLAPVILNESYRPVSIR